MYSCVLWLGGKEGGGTALTASSGLRQGVGMSSFGGLVAQEDRGGELQELREDKRGGWKICWGGWSEKS